MATFLLIHGAWSGGWFWDRVARRLAERGHAAEAPDLPGHGDDPADPTAVTMDDYVARVVERLRALPEPAILVGHSMGGLVVSAAAEVAARVAPGRVRALVYVCAYLPRDGQSLATLAARGLDPRPALALEAEAGGDLLTVPPERGRALFFNRTDEATLREAQARLQPQPTLPFGAPVRLGPAYDGLPKHQVECLEDRAIPPALARAMAEAAPGVVRHRLDADHAAPLSRPRALADLLHGIAAHA